MEDEGLYVFDSCAVVALLQGEPGAELVAGILKNSRNRCLIHAVNACEVYYDIYRRGGEEDASALEEILANAGIELVNQCPPRSGGLPANSKPSGGECRWPIASRWHSPSWRMALS